MYATRSVATRLSIFKLMQGSPRAVPSATMYKQLSHVWRKSDATSIWDIPPRCGPSQRVEGRLCWYVSCDYPKARHLPVKAEYLVVVEVVSSHADASVRCWSHLAVCPVFEGAHAAYDLEDVLEEVLCVCVCEGEGGVVCGGALTGLGLAN